VAGILFIISAPSGSGKSTLVDRLRSQVDGLEFSISYTTRRPRGSEEDGRQYHFVSRMEFESMIAADEFLEYADVFGNCYGTARKSLESARVAGKDLLLDIDIQGAAQVRQKLPEAVSIFVMPPNRDVLERRLRSRSRAEGVVAQEVIERRLNKAAQEIENYREYGYILVNDELERAVDDLSAVVMSERMSRGGVSYPDVTHIMKLAESCRQRNSEERVRPVLASFGLLDSQAAHA
jgi:guanylate kinase